MSTRAQNTQELEEKIQHTLIRDLVEEHPEIMSTLNQHGIDICCGGGLTVPQAAEAHNLDMTTIEDQMILAVRKNGN